MRDLALLSVGLNYLAAGNTILARVAGTCTQGDADRLFGVVVSSALYGLALVGLWAARPGRGIALVFLPAAPVIIWPAWFSARLMYEIVALGRSACGVLQGVPPDYPMSGSEGFFAVSWPIMSFGVLLGFIAVLVRSRQDRSDEPGRAK